MRTLSLLSVLVVAVFASAQSEPPPFAAGTLTELRARAKADGMALVVDFSTDAIEPSRRLLATTWRDQALWQWLGKHALAARIDPEADPAAVGPLALSAYPTILVFNKDGAEIDRIVGYVEAAALRERLAKIVHVFPTDYRERQKLADRLRKQGDLDGALEHYLWLWDHGEEHNQGFSGVRVSFFLSKFAEFAQTHPPAQQALEQRCTAAYERVLGGELDYAIVSDLTKLATTVGKPELLVQVLDRVPAEKWRRESVARRVLLQAALPALVAAKRHQEAVTFVGDPVSFFEESSGLGKDMPPLPEPLRRGMVDRAVGAQAVVLEAFFGARDERVATLVDRILQDRGTAKTWLMILTAAKKAGHDVACHDYAVRALQELPEEDHKAVRDFLQRK